MLKNNSTPEVIQIHATDNNTDNTASIASAIPLKKKKN